MATQPTVQPKPAPFVPPVKSSFVLPVEVKPSVDTFAVLTAWLDEAQLNLPPLEQMAPLTYLKTQLPDLIVRLRG